MPYCCVKNCKSRTSGATKTTNIKFFAFPQKPDIKKKWLEACHLDENFNVNCAKICERHFTPECIEEKWTKPRTPNTESRIMRRLKTCSVPTKLLDLPNEGRNRVYKRSTENDHIDHTKTSICHGIPTYRELVANVRSIDEKSISTTANEHAIFEPLRCEPIVENAEDPPLSLNHLDVHDQSKAELEKLQQLLKEAEERNKQLLLENKQLLEENDNLQKSLKRKSDDLEDMKKEVYTNGQEVAADILHTVFTPCQVKKLMSTNMKRMKWSAEDISSAIALRSLSGKTYKYLREVKKLPLPCESTLRNWTASFDTKPGILKHVLKIMESKGADLSIADKLTVLTFDEIYISNQLDLERKEQKVYGPYKTCQVVMA